MVLKRDLLTNRCSCVTNITTTHWIQDMQILLNRDIISVVALTFITTSTQQHNLSPLLQETPVERNIPDFEIVNHMQKISGMMSTSGEINTFAFFVTKSTPCFFRDEISTLFSS